MGGLTDLGVFVHEGHNEVFDGGCVALETDGCGCGFADVDDGIGEKRKQERGNLAK